MKVKLSLTCDVRDCRARIALSWRHPIRDYRRARALGWRTYRAAGAPLVTTRVKPSGDLNAHATGWVGVCPRHSGAWARVEIDPNVRTGGNLTYARFENVHGRIEVGAPVEVYEPESSLAGEGRIVRVHADKRLVDLWVDWEHLTVEESGRER